MCDCVITIGREYGSGGKLIGKKLSEILELPLYDKELVALTAKQSGFNEKAVEMAEQQRTQSFLYSLYMTSEALPFTDQVFIAQSKVIRELSDKGPCIIVGRCADYTLRDKKRCLRIFIHAPIEERIQRVRDVYGVKEKNLEAFVRKEDKKRSSYYNYFTQNKWGNPHNYHLSIDSSIGLDLSANLIVEAAKGVL